MQAKTLVITAFLSNMTILSLYASTSALMRKLKITVFLFLSFVLFGNTYAEWNYKKVQSARECAECHEDAVEVWKETSHFKTFKRFSQNSDAKKIASKMGVKRIKKADTLCTECHYTVGAKGSKKKVVSGISCESCHAPSADWIDVHNKYGGKGVKKKQETAAHKKQRYAELEKLGMIRPSNIYGWAKNCYACHIVAKENLVNKGGHKAGSDFKLFERSQGDILHTDKATDEKADLIKLIGFSVELEMSLRAVGEASAGNNYSNKMVERAKKALSNLKKANSSVKKSEISSIIKMADSTDIKAGNSSNLNRVSDAISVAARIAVEDEMGYRFANLDRGALKVKVASTKTATKKAETKKAVTKKAETKKVVTKKAETKKVVTKKAETKKAVTKKADTKKTDTKKAKTKKTEKKVQVAKLTSSKSTTQTRIFSKSNLIDSFELLSPRSSSLCNTESPWILGARKINENEQLSNDACISLSVKPNNDGWLYVFSETKSGELLKLLPNTCNAIIPGDNQIRRGDTTNLPLDKNAQGSVLNLKDYPGVAGFYAVLVDTSAAKGIVDKQTDSIADICSNSPVQQNLKDKLANLINQTEGHLDWEYQHLNRQ